MRKMTIKQAKSQLIDNIVFKIAINGAFQRNNVYCRKMGGKDIKEFKIYLKETIENTLNVIIAHQSYCDQDHYRNIEKISKIISKRYHWCLRDGRMNIGTAQKLLNLYWKMKWVFNKNIFPPIHCPFDGVIIKKLGNGVKNIKWTLIEDIGEYKKLVRAARRESKGECLSDWELKAYNSGNGIAVD